MRHINEIILHCSWTEEGKEYDVEDIRRWHKARGWRDVGYHYVVLLNGDVQIGRGIDEVGAHVKGRNSHSIGICYIGGLKDGKAHDTMTWKQFYAVYRLCCSLYDVLGRRIPLRGHNEFSTKECPSFDVSYKFPYLYALKPF